MSTANPNIHGTVNVASPINLPQAVPSVFELLAQERLTDLIRPCLRKILKFLHEIRPLSTTLRTAYKYKDELILLIEGIVQWFYLHTYSALVGEHFYGLKRTANHRLRSMIFSVLLPYIKIKLESLHDQMRANENTTGSKTRRRAFFYFVLKFLPQIQVFIEGVCWLYRLGYAFGRIEYYSPVLQLADVKLTYSKEPIPTPPPTTAAGRIFALFSKLLSSGLFLIQFIDWFNSTKKSILNPTGTTSTPPLPKAPENQPPVGRGECPICRQQCNVPTAVVGSGYVYCNTCITDYVKRHQRCPITNQPVTEEQLIKVY